MFQVLWWALCTRYSRILLTGEREIKELRLRKFNFSKFIKKKKNKEQKRDMSAHTCQDRKSAFNHGNPQTGKI